LVIKVVSGSPSVYSRIASCPSDIKKLLPPVKKSREIAG
jgi:hypothetical protein